ATGTLSCPRGGRAAHPPARTACPTGTHVAVLGEPGETDSARMVAAGAAADLWIALRAPTTLGLFSWDLPEFAFVPDRYHGFVAANPNLITPPQCVVMNDGWRDRACLDTYVPLSDPQRP